MGVYVIPFGCSYFFKNIKNGLQIKKKLLNANYRKAKFKINSFTQKVLTSLKTYCQS